ncbi:MAG TPA: TetR family transcriptional regulator [Ktedonobacteraceae bacterium]
MQRIASILDAAESVFAAMGYDEATTNHIAAQAQQYDSNLRVRGQTNRPSQEYSQILGKS